MMGFSRKLKQYGFVFDQRRCTGCKTCMVACKDYHGLEGGLAFRVIYEYAGGDWVQDEDGAWIQDVFCYYLSLSCNHCSNPVCVRFCSSGCIKKDDQGFVTIDASQCLGCQQCMLVCPYHAPRFDERRGVAVKCDGCRDRVREDRAPICVDSCPQRALYFGPFGELDLDSCPDTDACVAPLPSPDLTQPNYLVKRSAVAREMGDGKGSILNLCEV